MLINKLENITKEIDSKSGVCFIDNMPKIEISHISGNIKQFPNAVGYLVEYEQHNSIENEGRVIVAIDDEMHEFNFSDIKDVKEVK